GSSANRARPSACIAAGPCITPGRSTMVGATPRSVSGVEMFISMRVFLHRLPGTRAVPVVQLLALTAARLASLLDVLPDTGLHVADPAPSSLLLVRVERPGKITLRLPHLDLQRAQTGLSVLRLLRPRLARVVVDAGEVADQGVSAVRVQQPVSARVVDAALHAPRHEHAVAISVLDLDRARPRPGLRHDLPDPTPTRLALALPAHRSDQVDAVRAESGEVRIGERTMRRRPRRHLDVGGEVPAPPRLIGEARDAAAPQLPPRTCLRLPARVHAEQQPRRGLSDHVPVRVLRPTQNPLRHIIEPV